MTLKEHFRTNFNIRLLIGEINDSMDQLFRSKILKDFCSEYIIFKYNQIEIKADPFLFVHNDTLFLFYEEKLRKGKGLIKMTCTKNLKSWTDPVVILKEPFHLSFPFVFQFKDNVYLMPESGDAGEIRIYKFCDDSLTAVDLYSKPLIGEFVDSSIVFKDNKIYLFTSDRDFNQRVFLSDDLKGTFIEHPSSPIYSGKDFGRNAGSVFLYKDEYFRPSQDCSRLYGGNVTLHRLDYITPTQISETIYRENIIDVLNPFYKYGGHQFNLAIFKGRVIISTDALALNYNIFKVFSKFIKKTLKTNV